MDPAEFLSGHRMPSKNPSEPSVLVQCRLRIAVDAALMGATAEEWCDIGPRDCLDPTFCR